MHPTLVKLTVLKSSLIPRSPAQAWLLAHNRADLLPLPRHAADALRVAQTHIRQERRLASQADLVRFGQDHLFESDLRRLAQALLEPDATLLWPGVWVLLGASTGPTLVQDLASQLTAGAMSLTCWELACTPQNTQRLADTLAQEYGRQLTRLHTRLVQPRPNVRAIEHAYLLLACKIRQAEETLGVALEGLTEQQTVATALRGAEEHA